jgi:DNA primase
MPGEHRIYGLETVTDLSNPVFIVEGEKCTFALQGLGYQAAFSLGGCGQANKADWSTLQGAEQIYILPDFGEPALNYAYNVYKKIKDLNGLSAVKLLRFTLREKADV